MGSDQIAYSFQGESRTFTDMWSDIQGFARTLLASGIEPGARVVLALPSGHDFFTAFYGAQCAGGVAVPIYPGVPPERMAQVADLCGARHVVIPFDTTGDVIARLHSSGPALHVLTPRDRTPSLAPFPDVHPDDVAFIQYTSGSTGDPKGVQLSHTNLLTNLDQLIEGMEITPEDRFVSWLPTYHDMGLILMTMVPFHLGAALFLLPTSLRDTSVWLDTIADNGATFTASPDFGYRLCLRHVAQSRGVADTHDLSTLRVALNAAEPVRASTIESFHAAFGLHDVMIAGYGLAEATVGVSTGKPGTPVRVDSRGSVSVGQPFRGVSIDILDNEGQEVPAGEPGNISVTSTAATRGYFENPSATDGLFMDGGAVRTGDIGYVDDRGFLYVLGRTKDVIIHAGRSVYPDEVEEVVNDVEGVRYSAAIGVDNGRVEGEQVTVLAEIRPKALADEPARKSCLIAITQAVHERFGFRPGRSHLVAPRTIPLTHNGKLRRAELKTRYVDGALDAELLYPPRSPP